MGHVAALRTNPPRHRTANRWVQVVASAVGMMAIAAVVFVWPLLRAGPGRGLAETIVATQNAFAFFVIAETIFVPLESWLGDRFPRWILVGAGIALVVASAIGGARSEAVRMQVAWSALGGVGAGLAYGGTVAKALKRFTDRKALCVGVTAVACVGVLGLALLAIAALSSSSAIPLLVVLGGGQAFVIVIATLFILYPPPDRSPPDW